MINNGLKSDIYRKIKIEYFYFVYRFLGDLCTVVGGCDGNGGRAAAAVAAAAVVVDFVVVDVGGAGDDMCECWIGIGLERTDACVIGVQIVGWRRVAVVVWGWNNGPNWVVVVVVPAVGSNNGFSRDWPNVKWGNDGCRLNVDISSNVCSSFGLLLSHRRRIDGKRRKIRNPVNVIIRTIQNAATIVFVKIRFSNIRWLSIFWFKLFVFSSCLCSCFKIAVMILLVLVLVILLRVDVVVGARNIGIINDGCGT